MQISLEQLQPIKKLYDQSLYLRAYEMALQLTPLNEWEGTDAMLLAGRLAGNLGAPKLARRLHLRAWREHRDHFEATYYYVRTLWEFRGPWRAWMFVRGMEELASPDPMLQSDWLGLRAALMATLRDFDAAEDLLVRAEKVAPDNPWMWVEKSTVLQSEDRYDEALVATRKALELNPDYRPAIQSAAHLLSLTDRELEACALLESAVRRLECPSLYSHLAQIQFDLEDYSAAKRNFERSIEMSPLLEPEVQEWLNGRLSDAAYMCGEYDVAANLADNAGDGFYKTIATRLRETSPDKRRVKLPVGFIRQHHLTCAPATLTTISRFWHMPAEHLEVAEQICYGGTTDHSERKWAEQNGWQTREFCVNWGDMVKLIDRGVPFSLTTIDPGNGHLQAIIGYDEKRGSILIRDPYIRSLSEGIVPEMLDHYLATGPRGMVMVPVEKAALLDGLELKDALLYDQLHGVQYALYRHQREEAIQIWLRMANGTADHRLTLQARLAIAWYDEDYAQALSCIERLLVQFPDDANLKMQKASCLRTLARRSERLDYLKKICAGEKADPYFRLQLAIELSEDSREHHKALRLLHRSLRARPVDASNFYYLANIRWAQRDFDEALSLYRFAACLKDTEEQFVRSYFVAARHLRRREEALKFLIQRFDRLGKRSGSPARTLSWAYEQIDQAQEALQVLQEGVQLRPDDGELMLYAADAFARYGDIDQARIWLQAAEGKAAKTQILRNAAGIASYRGELRESLALWKLVLDAEPLAMDANSSVAQLLAETDGQDAAVEFLSAAAARFPHYFPLHQLLLEWLRDEPAEAEKALRHAIEIEPANSWARREMAFTLSSLQRYDEALEQAVIGRELEPDNPFGECAIATVQADMGNFPLARQAYREAIRISIDTRYAIQELMRHSHTPAERRESLEFIGEELIRQVTLGDGVLGYRTAARDVLDGEEVLKLIEAALDARPDLWHAWSAVVYQLMDLQRLDEALDLAKKATEQFPLMPRIWLDLAIVYQARLDRQGTIEALQQARRINPAWSTATQHLAEVYQRAGDFEHARKLIEQAIAYSPLDSPNYGYLADILWQMGRREEALEKVKQAVTMDPGYDWGWRSLRSWAQILEKNEFALECAKSLIAKRPGQARSWLVLAQTEGQELDERLKAIERALKLNPRLLEAHNIRARLLVKAQRYDEARAACRPEIFGDKLPPELQCTEALVEAEYGDLRDAVKKLERLVEVEPNYFQAWNLLADWHRAMKELPKYLNAAQVMVRLEPHRAIPLGYLAEAQLLTDARVEAKKTLRHAMTLDPTYEFASTTLFDLQLQDYEFTQVEETLKILRQQIGGDRTLVCELKLAGKRKDFAAARANFKSLCLSPTAELEHLRDAIEADMEYDWGASVDQILIESLDSPAVNRNVRALVADRYTKRNEWERAEHHLMQIPPTDDLWQRVANSYTEALARSGKGSLFWDFISRNLETLRANEQTWGHVGYVIYSFADRKKAIDWLADWRERRAVEGWMLWNLALALRDHKRDRESSEVSRHALGLPPDELTQSHALMVAFDELMNGASADAFQLVNDIHEPSLRDWDRMLWRMVCTLRDFRKTSSANGTVHHEVVNRLIAVAHETQFFGKDELLIRMHHEAVVRIAREKGSLLFSLIARLRLAWKGFLSEL